jgi:hypothetical protein
MVGMNTERDVIWKIEVVNSENKDKHEHSLVDDGREKDR